MKKIDKKVDLLKKLQAEIDRRTQVENEAVRLIEAGEHEKATELLKALSDQIVKNIEADLDKLVQEPEGENGVPDTMEPLDEQMRLLLKEFLMEFMTGLMIALFHGGRVNFDQVIRRYTRKISKLKMGDRDNQRTHIL